MVVQRHLTKQTTWPSMQASGSTHTGQPMLGLDGRTSLGTRRLGFGIHP